MSNSEELPKEMPSRSHEFHIDTVGNHSRKKFKGNFRYNVPNLKTKASIDKMRATMNNGLDAALSPEVLDLHFMVAYLRYTLDQYPDWWKESDHGYELDDFNVIREIYDECDKYEREYQQSIWGDGE